MAATRVQAARRGSVARRDTAARRDSSVDPPRGVDELREVLVANAGRVIDRFRDWDDNGDGRVSKED